MNRVLLGCVSLLASIAGCTSSPPVSTHEELRKFAVPAGDAPTALMEFSRQANKQVLFDFGVLRSRQTRGVEGMLQPSEALRSMLEGTGLVASNVDEITVAITPH